MRETRLAEEKLLETIRAAVDLESRKSPMALGLSTYQWVYRYSVTQEAKTMWNLRRDKKENGKKKAYKLFCISSQCYLSLGLSKISWSQCSMPSFLQFIYSFCYAGADIVQWLMKNLSIEDQGKVNHGWELTDISAVLCVCHKSTYYFTAECKAVEQGWFKHLAGQRKAGKNQQLKSNILQLQCTESTL